MYNFKNLSLLLNFKSFVCEVVLSGLCNTTNKHAKPTKLLHHNLQRSSSYKKTFQMCIAIDEQFEQYL